MQHTPPPQAWKDNDTMLSFGAFAAIVLAMLVWRIADPANWITIEPEAAAAVVVEMETGSPSPRHCAGVAGQ